MDWLIDWFFFVCGWLVAVLYEQQKKIIEERIEAELKQKQAQKQQENGKEEEESITNNNNDNNNDNLEIEKWNSVKSATFWLSL